MKGCKGYVSSVYNGSAVDGPGLRCVVFLSGCNFRCPFCHNIETLAERGEEFTAEALAERLLRYREYMAGGGVTFSGGEPFLQAAFVLRAIELLRGFGIRAAVETNGSIANGSLIAAADTLIADVKNYAAPDAGYIEAFLQAAARAGKTVRLTNVLIPGINDTKAHFGELKALLGRHGNIGGLTFLPFRKLCAEKYERLGERFLYADKREADGEDIRRAERAVGL